MQSQGVFYLEEFASLAGLTNSVPERYCHMPPPVIFLFPPFLGGSTHAWGSPPAEDHRRLTSGPGGSAPRGATAPQVRIPPKSSAGDMPPSRNTISMTLAQSLTTTAKAADYARAAEAEARASRCKCAWATFTRCNGGRNDGTPCWSQCCLRLLSNHRKNASWPFDVARIERSNGCAYGPFFECGSHDCLTILTRSGVTARDQLFGELRDALVRQEFAHVHHFISTENTGCRFLPPWRSEARSTCKLRTTIVPVSRSGHSRGYSCPYNAFLRAMLKRVDARSWIMILDDDALLLHPSYLANVMRHVLRAPKTSIVLQPSHVGPPNSSISGYGFKWVWPGRGWKDESTARLRIDMSNLIFHQSMVQHINVHGECGADKLIFRQLLKAGGKPLELSLSDTGGVGIWSNYRGAARGDTPPQWLAEAPASGCSAPLIKKRRRA